MALWLLSTSFQARGQAADSSSCSVHNILFTPSNTVGCADPGFTINIAISGNTNGTGFDYNNPLDGTLPGSLTTSTTHNYTAPGTFNIVIFTQVPASPAVTGCFDTIQVRVRNSPPPDFEIIACAGNSFRIKIKDSTYQKYYIRYGQNEDSVLVSGTRPFLTPTYSFPAGNTGTKTVTVEGNYVPGGCGATSSGSFPLVQSLSVPKLNRVEILSANPGRIQLEFVTDAGFNYRIYRKKGNGNFILIDTVVGAAAGSTYTDSVGLATATDSYCYRITAADVCGATVQGDEVCSIRSFKAVAADSENRIDWGAYSQPARLDRFELYRRDITGPIFSSKTNSFVDTSVICGNQYCYYLQAVLSDGSVSITDTKCVTAFSSTLPPSVDSIFSTFTEGNQALVTYTLPTDATIKSIYIFRSAGDSVKLDGSGIFLDTRSPARTCYSVSIFDSCDNKGLAPTKTCPVFLTAQKQGFSKVSLKWTDFVKYKNGVAQYVVEKLDRDGNVYASIPLNGGLLSYSDDFTSTNPDGLDLQSQVIRYRVRALPNDATEGETLSNFVDIRQDNRIRIPTAFTPDGDGLNDELTILSAFIRDYRLLIYNRWGELIFASESATDYWDGTYNGNLVPSGVYAYIFEGTDFTGESVTEKGTITVLSKR